MKRSLFPLVLFCACAAGGDPELSRVHSVYLLPMSRGMDQYLASALTRAKVYQVVTDPKAADAVMSDRLGEAFEQKLADLVPSPEPVAPVKDEKDARGDTGPGAAVNRLSNPALSSSFGSGRGTMFLVGAKSHLVLWSIFDPPRNSNPKELERTASAIVSRLKRDLKMKE